MQKQLAFTRENVKKELAAQGKTLKELADFLNMTYKNLSKKLCGWSGIKFDTIKAIAEFLGCVFLVG